MEDQKKKILTALKKARTSIDKIITRIENDGDDNGQCFDTMQQTLSAIGLLKNANNHILELHLTNKLHSLKGKKLFGRALDQTRDDLVEIVRTAQKS